MMIFCYRICVTPMSFIICNFCSFGRNKLIFCVSEDNVCIFMYGKYYYCGSINKKDIECELKKIKNKFVWHYFLTFSIFFTNYN